VNRYTWFMGLDQPARQRPTDWAPFIATIAPGQLMAFAHRHAADPRHHWNDPGWINGGDLAPRMDPELLRMRGAAAKRFPGLEVN
jgi:hypothetical protein